MITASLLNIQDILQGETAAISINIRPAVADDIPLLINIEQASFSDPWLPQTIINSLAEDRTLVLVAAGEDGVYGYGVAWTVGDEGEITHIAVAPERRSRGIGRQLLISLLNECTQRGSKSIFLEVRVSNNQARRLYERCGFRGVGLRRGYYRDGEDAVIMRWDSG